MKSIFKKINLFSVIAFAILYCNDITAISKRTQPASGTIAKKSFDKNAINHISYSEKSISNNYYNSPTPEASSSEKTSDDIQDHISFYENMRNDIHKIFLKDNKMFDKIQKITSKNYNIDQLRNFFKIIPQDPIIKISYIKNIQKTEIAGANMWNFVVCLRKFRKITSIISISHIHVLATCALTLNFSKILTQQEITDVIKRCYEEKDELKQLSYAIFKERVALANA